MTDLNLFVLCNNKNSQDKLSLILDNISKREMLKLNIVYSEYIKNSKKEIRDKFVDFIILNDLRYSDDKLIDIINSIKQDKNIFDIPIIVISTELKDDYFRNKILKKGVTLYTENKQNIINGSLLNIISMYKSNSNLLKETKYIRKIWNTSKNINIILDDKFNIVDFNNTAKRKFHFINKKINIKEFVSLMDIEDNQKLAEHLDYSLDMFGDMSNIYIFRYENQYYKVNVRFLNKINNYLIAFDNITSLEKQKQQNEMLHQKHMKDLETSKDKMITIFTHELKTPLNGILGYSAYISRTLKKTLNEKKIDKLSSLSSEITALGHVLLSTINSLVDISSLKNNQLKVIKTSTDVESIITNMINVYNVIYKKDLDINIDIKYINTDTKIIKDIFENIFSNALKYGRDKVIISLKEIDGNRFCLIIEDDGDGIPDDKRDEIFKSLEQGEAEKISRKKEGIGLGLTLVYNLSLLMNYEIEVLKSETLGGAKFLIKGDIK